MKQLLKLEEIAQMLAIFVIVFMLAPGYAWWIYPVIFFLPDLGIAAYAFSPKAGAAVYNFFHHKAVALIMIAVGWFSVPALLVPGLLFFSHSAFDRAMGYGLKYAQNFHHTHLGVIGRVPKG